MKTIVYLDQNYVSDLTKARLGVKLYPHVPTYYSDLYSALRDAVQRNQIVCPVSHFHYSESELDSRLAPEVLRTLEELYCGVELLHFSQIIQAQAAAALRHFLGIARPRQPKWKAAFNKNPHTRFDSKIEPVHYHGSGMFTDLSRYTKAYHEKQRELKPVGSLQQQKRVEALRFIFDSYLRPPLIVEMGKLDIFTLWQLDLYANLRRRYSDLRGRLPGNVEIVSFLESEHLMATPFVDVYSSLRAGMILWEQERKPKGSDLNDVLIGATVLPYCDVFATDGGLKQRILALKLDKQYTVSVFGPRKADVKALTSLIKGLPSPDTPRSPPSALAT